MLEKDETPSEMATNTFLRLGAQRETSGVNQHSMWPEIAVSCRRNDDMCEELTFRADKTSVCSKIPLVYAKGACLPEFTGLGRDSARALVENRRLVPENARFAGVW